MPYLSLRSGEPTHTPPAEEREGGLAAEASPPSEEAAATYVMNYDAPADESLLVDDLVVVHYDVAAEEISHREISPDATPQPLLMQRFKTAPPSQPRCDPPATAGAARGGADIKLVKEMGHGGGAKVDHHGRQPSRGSESIMLAVHLSKLKEKRADRRGPRE